MAEYTKGKWDLELRPADNCQRIRTKNEVIADVYGTIAEDAGNAQLIITAVNACIFINPENPMAVIKGIEGAFALAELIRFSFERNKGQPVTIEMNSAGHKLALRVLSKITGGK